MPLRVAIAIGASNGFANGYYQCKNRNYSCCNVFLEVFIATEFFYSVGPLHFLIYSCSLYILQSPAL